MTVDNPRCNLSALADKNEALVKKLGFDPQTDDPFDLDNPQILRDSGLFNDMAINTMFTQEPPASLPEEVVPETIPQTIGMVLLRPDMVQIAPRTEAYLAARFNVLDVSTTTVTPDKYWAMYSDAIVGREMRQSRLTRAAVYIGSPCRLIVFERPETKIDNVPAADYTFKHLKGSQGVPTSGTLRGDLVYHEAVNAGLHTLHDPAIALAVDPFGAYRKIVTTNVPGKHTALNHPLLFFTGVGIHIPDHTEMQRDLTILGT